MKFAKYGSITLITFVLVAGIAIPLSPSPQNWLQFPVIPGLEEKARNILYHVPVAWTTVVAFLVSTYYGFRYLKTRDIDYDIKSVSAAGLGFLFCFLATVTGALWAKFNWGSFWNWDPRETSIFVLLLIYGAYFALRSALETEEKRATLSAVYSMIAGITVPFFIFVMPRIMTGLHPGAKEVADPAAISKAQAIADSAIAVGSKTFADSALATVAQMNVGSAVPVVQLKMSPNMLVIFLLGLLGFTLLFIWLLNVRVRLARMEYERSTHHE
ncbi:MAG: cytochrome c biogenesis protein CcsA [Ignavibacteriales bacterium]|nr:cytochrome c biogenesis protein CcsA [Ignavibacteriales bacterium]